MCNESPRNSIFYRKKHVNILYFSIAILVLCGCNGQKKHVENVLSQMIGTKVDLCIPHMESRQRLTTTNLNKFKMIVYVDSTECTPCALSHLRYWNPIIKETKNLDVCYIFIIAPKMSEIYDINVEMEVTDLESSIFIDNKYVFLKRNKNIPHEDKYHTFLLNNKNDIILVGSPIHNKQIKKIFYNILKTKKQ